MKKATLILWVIIFGFIALFIFQNQPFFLTKNAFNLNLGIRAYPIPELYNAVLVLVFFCIGLVIAYLFSISARFKAKRTIKKLNTTIAAHINETAELKHEINALKSNEAPVDSKADTIVLDVNAGRKIADQIAAATPADKTVKVSADDAQTNPGEDNAEDTKESSSEKKQ